jgi:hypothetical protein
MQVRWIPGSLWLGLASVLYTDSTIHALPAVHAYVTVLHDDCAVLDPLQYGP